MRIIGSGIYEVCRNCAKIAKMNRVFVGSIHLCTLDRVPYAQYIRVKVEFDKAADR